MYGVWNQIVFVLIKSVEERTICIPNTSHLIMQSLINYSTTKNNNFKSTDNSEWLILSIWECNYVCTNSIPKRIALSAVEQFKKVTTTNPVDPCALCAARRKQNWRIKWISRTLKWAHSHPLNAEHNFCSMCFRHVIIVSIGVRPSGQPVDRLDDSNHRIRNCTFLLFIYFHFLHLGENTNFPGSAS